MHYLIDVLRIETADLAPVFQQRWQGTHDDLHAATVAFETLLSDPFVSEAVLLSWVPGPGAPLARISQGSWALRNTVGGIPRQTILRHASRPVLREVFANPSRNVAGYVFGDWEDQEDSAGIEPTTQPGPGFKLKPTWLLGKPIHILNGLRATSPDPDIPGPFFAFIHGEGWKRFERVHPCAIG